LPGEGGGENDTGYSLLTEDLRARYNQRRGEAGVEGAGRVGEVMKVKGDVDFPMEWEGDTGV